MMHVLTLTDRSSPCCLVTQHADERDYRNIADGLGGPMYGLCDQNAITPLCLGLGELVRAN